jgi:hypothetical protein
VNKLGSYDKQPELQTFFDHLGQDVGHLQLHNPSTAGVHGGTEDENFNSE